VVDVHAELAGQPLDGDGEVRLAHAAQHRLVRLVVALEHQRRVLGLQAVERGGQSLSSSAWVLALIAMP
jgi:hypothetical protein